MNGKTFSSNGCFQTKLLGEFNVKRNSNYVFLDIKIEEKAVTVVPIVYKPINRLKKKSRF